MYLQQQSNNISKTDVNLVHEKQQKDTPFDGFYAFNILSSMEKNAWIIDSGASKHICSDPLLMHTTYKLDKSVEVHLPDGSLKAVVSARKVKLNKDILLVDVLYIPGFTHNLLSVAKLVQDFGIKCIFYKTHCVFQRDNSNQLLGVGRMKENLYIIDSVMKITSAILSIPER